MLGWLFDNWGWFATILGGGGVAYFVGPALVFRFIGKHWAPLTILGLILAGVFLFDRQADARVAAERRADAAETRAEGLEASLANAKASDEANALEVARLTARLSAEAELSRNRIAQAEQRARLAETRNSESRGLINDLRQRLDQNSAADCDCGIGGALYGRLRHDRAERDAILYERYRGLAEPGGPSLRGSGGFDASPGNGAGSPGG